MKKCLLLMLLVLLALSCKRYHCPVNKYCGVGFNFVLVGYTHAELDTVIIRAYKADGTFSGPVDTAIFVDSVIKMTTNGPVYTWQPLFGTSKDSFLKYPPLLSDKMGAEADTDFVTYDWEIYIRSMHKTHRILAMKFGGDIAKTLEDCDSKGNHVGASCTRYLATYVLDGKTYNFPGHPFMDYYNYLFVKK